MIIYMKCGCTSKDRQKVAELKSQGHEVRLTKNYKWANEARLYNLKPPFKVIDEENKIGEPL